MAGDLEISPGLISDLSDLADLLGKSLAQAGLDREGAGAHLDLARRRSAAVASLLTAVARAGEYLPATRAESESVTDLGQHISRAEASVKGLVGELPWDLIIRRPAGMRVNVQSERLEILLDSMLALALVWFPDGGALSLHVEAQGKLAWTRMEYTPGPDSPPLVDGLRLSAKDPKAKKSQEPAGMVALNYLGRAAGAQVEFALIKSEKARLSVGLPSSSATPRPARGARILVVDDDPDSAFMLEQAVIKAGYETVIAYDGLTALSRARDEHVVLVLLDVMLPGMDGYEVLRRLRSETATADLPIVMVSAKSRPEDIETGLRLGANEYLVKPLRLADVVACVRDQIGEPPEK